jgi:hypothetical protein
MQDPLSEYGALEMEEELIDDVGISEDDYQDDLSGTL